jgi:hypothetical protein
MTDRNLGVTIDVRRDVLMYHTVLCVDQSGAPTAVSITTNPLDHSYRAVVVMHKTRSHSCAVQVARYVRRTFGIEEPVQTHRAPRAVEAMIGYACTRTAQHAPGSYPDDIFRVAQHIAATPIKRLLQEVADGHKTSSTRYVVYEVRSRGHKPHRGITHRYDALERRYREAPPDMLAYMNTDLVQIGRYATHEEADMQTVGFLRAGDFLWERKPRPEYVRHVLRATPDNDIVWTCDGQTAIRHYDFLAVCIGPHVYTEFQVRHVLEHGEWPPNGNSLEGRRIMANQALAHPYGK